MIAAPPRAEREAPVTRVVICEFMDDTAVGRIGARHETLYDPDLGGRPEDLRRAVSAARALVVRNRTRVDAALLAAAPALSCVGRLGVGLDNIDLEACASRGVAVHPATGANEVAVAEYVLAAALTLLRGAYGSSAEVAAGRWPRQASIGREARGKRMGLVGFGAVARRTAALARALGFEVAAFDPHLAADDPAWAQAERLDLGALLARSDVVSLHVPLTDATRRMIDAEALAATRPGAIVINTARGGVVDERALAAALREGRIGGAALDVFEAEPLGAEAGRIFEGIANLILTPHVAGVTEELNARVGAMTADAVLRHLAGRA